MNLDEKYGKHYKKLSENIKSLNKYGKMPALGYTSNLDIICDFQIGILNRLLERFMQGENLNEMKAFKVITSERELISTLVYFCRKGIGGEVNITDTKIVENFFPTKHGIGGTAVQAAMALAAVEFPSLIHLTDDSKEVCNILDSPHIFTVSPNGNLVHTNHITQTQEQEKHYIIQFKKGDVIRLDDQELVIPESNRLIITKITVNATVPFYNPYFEYIEKNAKKISSNVLSSFNAINNEKILEERLIFVRKHINKYKESNKTGIVFFEDAHYHSDKIRRLCMETIYSEVDIVSMNEEELIHILEMYDFPIDFTDIISFVKGTKFIKDKFQIKKGVIVHTKDYSMYVGNKLKFNIESGLIFGNLLATTRAMVGRYGSIKEISKALELPLSKRGLQYRKIIEKSKFNTETILVPTKYIDRPRHTIGLGDTFVAGVQMCFIK